MKRPGTPTPSVFLVDPGDNCLGSIDSQTIERWPHCASSRCGPRTVSPGVPRAPVLALVCHSRHGKGALAQVCPQCPGIPRSLTLGENAELPCKGFAHWAIQKLFHSPERGGGSKHTEGIRFRVLSYTSRQNPAFFRKISTRSTL